MEADGNRALLKSSGRYALEGSVLELAPPRWRTEGPAARGSLVAWRIHRGHIGEVDVSGQVVLVISHPAEGREQPVVRAWLLDEQANPEQVLALLDAFQGRLGGPLAGLVAPSGETWGLSQVPIEYRLSPGRVEISVPDRLRVSVPVTSLPGSPSPVGTGRADVSIEGLEHSPVWHDHEAWVTYRHFHVRSGAFEEGTCLT